MSWPRRHGLGEVFHKHWVFHKHSHVAPTASKILAMLVHSHIPSDTVSVTLSGTPILRTNILPFITRDVIDIASIPSAELQLSWPLLVNTASGYTWLTYLAMSRDIDGPARPPSDSGSASGHPDAPPIHPSFIQVAKPYIFEQTIQDSIHALRVNPMREQSLLLQGVLWIDNVRKVLHLYVRLEPTAQARQYSSIGQACPHF